MSPTLLLVAASPITHARSWKALVPHLPATYGRHDRRPGNGRSDRPHERDRYALDENVADLLAVLDAAELQQTVVVACHAVPWALQLPATHPNGSPDSSRSRQASP